MSSNVSKDLIDLIDSRILTKRYQRVAVIESVSEDGKSATVSFPGTDVTIKANIKTPEKFKVGDSVTVSSVDGDLMNGYIQTRFGESSWISVGSGIDVDKGAIKEDNLAEGSVTEGKIADFSVTNAKIGFAEIDTANIRKASITTALIQDATITNAKIKDLAVDNAKIGIAAIDTANIKNAAITTACIGDAAIKTTQIADGSVTDAKIVGLTANKITAGTIDAGTISVINMDCANLKVGKINGVQIEDGAIGIAKLDAIVNDKIATAQATADGKNTIFYHNVPPTEGIIKKDDTWFDIDDGYKMYTYDGTTWAAAPFGTSAIDDSAVTGDKLANGTITGVKMIDGAITSRELATGSIIADKLAVGSVTSNAIESKSIKTIHIDTNTITADKLLLGDATNFSTVWLNQYLDSDWSEWTGMTFPTAIKDSDDYVYPSLTTNTDFLFSMPFDATALTTVLKENSFGFKFTTKNSSPTNKTALLSIFFFDLDKKYLNKTTLETFIINGITDDQIDNEIQDWDFITTVAKNTSAKYFVFGASIADGFTGMFKDIQIRRSVGSTFISDGTITTSKIVTDAITTDKLAAKSVIANKIASNTITTEEMAAGAITTDKLAANAVTASKIKAGEITTNHISSNFGETLNLSSNTSITITAQQLTLAGAVTFTNLSTSGQTTINGANITTGTISASRLDLSGVATFSQAQTLANTAQSNAISSVKTGLGTSGYTTIDGGNINTTNLTFSGGIQGGKFGINSGFSVSSTGMMDMYGGQINFGNYGAYITCASGGSTMNIYNAGHQINIAASKTQIDNLYANTQPANIPMTSSGTQKINAINYQTGTAGEHSIGTYLEVLTANYGAFGLNWWASDISLKKNIIDYSGTSALEKINKIKHREFDWKANDIHVTIGYVSQELMTIDNSFAFEVKQDGEQSTYQPNETVIIPTITKAIQELSAENDKLKTEVNDLKNKINELWEIINTHLAA